MALKKKKKTIKRDFDTKNTVGVVETKSLTFAEKEEEFLELDSGIKFGPITVAYETYGTLNNEKNNAILICHALSGSAHVAGFHGELGKKPGWWEDAVGPGKAFDTNKYFVVCSNVLGGCSGTTGPSSINPKTGKPYGLDFPVVTIGDMVKVQKKLLDFLGIERLLAVAGGSIGGMQALDWALRYPQVVRSALVIAATSRLSAQGIAFNEVGRNSILNDKNFNNGDYYEKTSPAEGLAVARMIGHITYLSDESMHAKFGRRMLNPKEEFSYAFDKEFQVESYLDHQGTVFVERFDANSYLYMTKASDYFDVAATFGDGDVGKAFERIQGRMLVVSFSSDWLFAPYHSVEVVDALIKNQKDVTYINIDSSYGHDAFLLELDTEGKIIKLFIDATYNKVKKS